MPSEVQADRNLGISKGQHRMVFRNPRGQKAYYAFYIGPGGSFGFWYEVSTDGITWSGAATRISANEVVEAADVKIYDDGAQLVVLAVSRIATAVDYYRGTIADGGTAISFSTQIVKTSIGNVLPAGSSLAVARTANGRLVIAFTEDFTTKGKDYRQTKLIGSDGDGAAPTWSGETIWDDPSGSTNNADKGQIWFGLESMSGDRVLLYARLPDSTSTTVYKTTTAVPTWNGTAFANTTQANVLTNNANHGKILSGVVDAANRAHLIAFDGANTRLDSFRAGTVDDDDWSAAVTVKSADEDACSLTLDTGPATDELYAFYHDVADTQDFHHKKTPVDTISWGTEQTITFASDLIALTAWNRDIESSLHIGIEDADTDVWYHEHALAAPAGQPMQKRLQGIPTGSGYRDRPPRWN